MSKLRFFILPFEPKVKQRPRGAAFRRGKKTLVKMYTPQPTIDYQNAVARHVAFEMESDEEMFTKDCILFAHFYMKTRRQVDSDNCLKALLDGLNEVLYTDDHLIKHLIGELDYDKGNPRTIFAVMDRVEFEKDPVKYYSEWRKYIDEQSRNE